MGILSFIGNTVIEYGASQGNPNCIDIIRRRDELREQKRQKKEAKRKKKWWYGFQGNDTARLDDSCDVYTAATQDDTH